MSDDRGPRHRHGMTGRRGEVVVSVRDVVKHFPITQGIVFQKTIGHVRAVDGVSFDLHRGETLGLVGESGCGKSTLSRVIMGLIPATSGSVKLLGEELVGMTRARAARGAPQRADHLPGPVRLARPADDRRQHRRRAVRDPPRGRPARRPAAARCRSCSRWSASTPSTSTATRTSSPAASGSGSASPGRWRCSPQIIVCDEPVSALDVSVQAQVINLLERLQDEFDLSYIFVAHDLSVVRHISDRVAVMYLGKIVEIGDETADLRPPDAPLHPGAAVGRPGARPRAARPPRADRARRATCPARPTRRRAAGSAPGAGRPRTSAPRRSPPLVQRRGAAPPSCRPATSPRSSTSSTPRSDPAVPRPTPTDPQTPDRLPFAAGPRSRVGQDGR